MLLDAPPLARAPGTAPRIDAQQRAFRARVAARVPSAQIGWRYRLVANGFSVTLPSSRACRSCARCRAFVTCSRRRATRRARPRRRSRSAPLHSGARALDTAGQGMKIGIIDSGIDPDHPFFDPAGYTMPAGFPEGAEAVHDREGDRGARVRTQDGRYGPSVRLAFDPDDDSHGTHVAGIAAGNADTPTGQGRSLRSGATRIPRQLQGLRRDRLGPEPERELARDRRRHRGRCRRWDGRHQLLGRRARDRAET